MMATVRGGKSSHIMLLEQLMYTEETVKSPDDGILRLCEEIQINWGGELLQDLQYGLKEAWEILSNAEAMDVAFAIRANLTFNGFHDDDSPIHGKAVTFRARDCLHVKAKYNEDWWIGRVVKVDAPIGFIPTPIKLRKLAQETATLQRETAVKRNTSIDKEKKKEEPTNTVSRSDSVESLHGIPQKRVSEIEPKSQGPYEAVPVIRPIILMGPSLRGFDITDLMHKALVHALVENFEDRLEILSIDKTMIDAFKSSIDANKNTTKPDCLGQITDRVFNAAKSFKLLFIDLRLDTPLPLRYCALAPILVHIKISNIKVLQNLIKQRGAEQKRALTSQCYGANKLNDLDKRNFDVILSEHDFKDAKEHLINYLEKYWRATRPYQTTKKHHGSILHNTPGFISRLQGIKSPKPPQYTAARHVGSVRS